MIDNSTDYGIRIELAVPFDEAVEKTIEALKEQEFGVLSDIDVKATLKKKLDTDFKKYRILGACNPPFAHEALQEEEDIGLLLPCNVIVYELDDNHTRVAAIDPVKALAVARNNQLQPLAEQVRDRLRTAIENLEKAPAGSGKD